MKTVLLIGLFVGAVAFTSCDGSFSRSQREQEERQKREYAEYMKKFNENVEKEAAATIKASRDVESTEKAVQSVIENTPKLEPIK